MIKAGNHTHLYLTQEIPDALKPLGKTFAIEEILPFASRLFKPLGKRFPRAEVTARNLPLGSDPFRKKLGCSSGGECHIFGLRFDFQAALTENKILITRPL